MVERDIFEIEISRLSQIEKVIDRSLRDVHNAMLLFSVNDILTTVDEYSDFFSITQNTIMLNEVFTAEFIKDIDYKRILVSRLQKYFTSGIPNSINNTLTAVLNEAI